MSSVLYVITFDSGETREEYGSSFADVRDFANRCYKHLGPIDSIAKFTSF